MRSRVVRPGLIVLLAAIVMVVAGPSHAAEKIGVVVLHGKGSTNKPHSPIGRLNDALEEAGFVTVAPEFPWSHDRFYTETVEEAFGEIDRAIAGLKAQGIRKVVLAGHSLGANMALAYDSRHAGLAGIVAIAPGHVPESPHWRQAFADDLARAKAFVAAGKGDSIAEFADSNQGRLSTITVRAAVYVSFFDPDGLAAMSRTAALLSRGTPVLWIVESNRKDQIQGRVTFDKIPDGVKKEYVVLDSSHNDAPPKSAARVIAWLKAL